eukprot:GEZU01030748.1.p1 GENE.GEZU01030748.1~~GEZU01030748.1.p1  ORF type:complete len:204 (-),score=53.69 GEZU01030748.1:184-795(-)
MLGTLVKKVASSSKKAATTCNKAVFVRALSTFTTSTTRTVIARSVAVKGVRFQSTSANTGSTESVQTIAESNKPVYIFPWLAPRHSAPLKLTMDLKGAELNESDFTKNPNIPYGSELNQIRTWSILSELLIIAAALVFIYQLLSDLFAPSGLKSKNVPGVLEGQRTIVNEEVINKVKAIEAAREAKRKNDFDDLLRSQEKNAQ